MPILPYQKTLYDALQSHKRIAILKSRGLGVTTFFVYYISWCCINKYEPNSRVLILTGNRIQLSQDIIARFKALFPSQLPETEKSAAIINNVRVEAFPSFHSSAARGYTDVRFLLVDEAAFWPPHQITEMMGVVSGYQSKPNAAPQTVFCSSPNRPGDMMHQLMLDDSNYHRLWFDYKFGLEGEYPIYSQSQIDESINTREFPREMELQCIGEVGNVFSPLSIENCQKIPYDVDTFVPANISIGLDPSFNAFGICATRFVNGRIEVIVAEEHTRPFESDMINRIFEIKRKYGNITSIRCDAANPNMWQALKREFNERYDKDYVFSTIAEYEKNNWDINSIMRIIPVPFSVNHAKMLQHAKSLVEDSKNLVLIDKRFDKLLTALRTAQAEEYKLSKEDTSYHDVLDSFGLSLLAYRRRN